MTVEQIKQVLTEVLAEGDGILNRLDADLHPSVDAGMSATLDFIEELLALIDLDDAAYLDDYIDSFMALSDAFKISNLLEEDSENE